MSQQQQQTTTAHYAGVSGKTRKQRDLETQNHVKQTEKELGAEQPPAKAGGLAITTKVGIRVKDPFSSPFQYFYLKRFASLPD